MFQSIFISFFTNAQPPNLDLLHGLKNGYTYGPLSKQGVIMTADVELWHKATSLHQSAQDVSLCPTAEDVLSQYTRAREMGAYFICALTNEEFYSPIDNPIERNRLATIDEISVLSADNFKLTKCGFDVVDRYTGISALANIGYSDTNLKKITSLGLESNNYGLLDTFEQIQLLIPVLSNVAPEHAPFVGVEVTFCKLSIASQELGR